MASRRTRIKGIANIPQRRKTINTSVNSDDTPKSPQEIGQKEEEIPNLTPKISHGSQGEDSVKSPPVYTHKIQLLPEVFPEKIKVEGEIVQLSKEVTVPQVVPEDASKAENEHEVKPPTLPMRRKFIKPTVSLSAINRKTKEIEDVKPIPVSSDAPKNNKIVILNEIIARPDQNQPIIIRNGTQDVTYAVPEMEKTILSPPPSGPGKSHFNAIERDIKRLVPNNVPVQTSDTEYPIPPPSPSKVNRSRIKAVPRLGQRNTSISASESEDESRRNHRHRNDSVCSTASGLQDSSSVSECPSPQKPKEFNSVIQRKCRRTEQSRKLAEARRDFYMKFGNKKPDRQKLTMIDLIFYNPTTNPMSHEAKKKEIEEETREEEKNEESMEIVNISGSDEENEMPAPQIKIGPEGEIVVDEQSLVIENKAVKKSREEIEKSQVINGDFDTGYGVYKRAKRSKDWSKHETLKFYKALNTIGTDFALMCELFPRRSRRELKMKFKKEERINRALIDRAIMQPCGFDFNDFKDEVDREEKELLELEKQKEREQQMKKEAKKRKSSLPVKNNKEKFAKVEKPKEKRKKKALDIYNVLDDDSDADESEIESVFDEDEENTQDKLLQTIQKPTRYGRVPKMLDKYKPPDSDRTLKAEPGSLIVVASTGSNGEPVYRVCMVTGGKGYEQVGNDMSSLSKALECKQNRAIQSVLTITASSINGEASMEFEENNITIPEENNVTIPEENNITIPEENNITIPEENNITIPAENNITIDEERNITIAANERESVENEITKTEEVDC